MVLAFRRFAPTAARLMSTMLVVLFLFLSILESTCSLHVSPDTPWVVPNYPSSSPSTLSPGVSLATRDIARDWHNAFGRPPIITGSPPSAAFARAIPPGSPPPVVIFFGSVPEIHKMLSRFYRNLPLPEIGVWDSSSSPTPNIGAHSCNALPPTSDPPISPLVCTGDSEAGVVFSMYLFAHSVLGIHPQQYWLQMRAKPKSHAGLDIPSNFTAQRAAPLFTTRALFINDEDLLGGFAPDPMGENVFSLEMWDRIFESILRLGGNGAIIGTAPLPDERCMDLAKRRGITIAQHHFTILGADTFRWPVGVPYSFSTSREVQERVWRTCVETLQDKDMVWTIGYRGLNDYAFWNDDPRYDTPAKRGKLISEAMAQQATMVRDITNSTSQRMAVYLWDEFTDLFDSGDLDIPEGAMRVFADNGMGIVGGNLADLQPGDGLYYHVAMQNSRANQLTEMIPPRRIFEQLAAFVRANATGLLVLNTSDMRPVPLGTMAVMSFIWDPTPFLSVSSQQAQTDVIRRFVAGAYPGADADTLAAVEQIHEGYFALPYMANDTNCYGEQKLSHTIRDIVGRIRSILLGTGEGEGDRPGLAPTDYGLVSTVPVLRDLASLKAAADDVLEGQGLPEWRRDFFIAHVATQIDIHYYLTDIIQTVNNTLTALQTDPSANVTAPLTKALASIDKLLVSRQRVEVGEWEGWLVADLLDNHAELRDELARVHLMSLVGKGVAAEVSEGFAMRYFHTGTGTWSSEFWYNDVVPSNFPLFYHTANASLDLAVLILCANTSSTATNTCPQYPAITRGQPVPQAMGTCSITPVGITLTTPNIATAAATNVTVCLTVQGPDSTAARDAVIRFVVGSSSTIAPSKESPAVAIDAHTHIPVTVAPVGETFLAAATFDRAGRQSGPVSRVWLKLSGA